MAPLETLMHQPERITPAPARGWVRQPALAWAPWSAWRQCLFWGQVRH
jgi:hypothetical protein